MIISEERKKELSREYFERNGTNSKTELEKMVDGIISSNFGDIPDKDEYYSVATGAFLQAVERYDGKQSFRGFLYVVVKNKVMSRLTSNNGATRSVGEIREKVNKDGKIVKQRVAVPNLSLDAKISDNDMTIADMVASNSEIDDEFLGEGYQKYLDSLPDIQRKLILMVADGYTAAEIQQRLRLSPKIYASELAAARSYHHTKWIIKENSISHKKKGGSMSETAQTSKQVVMTVTSYVDSVHNGDWCLEFSGQRLSGQWSNPQKGTLIETMLQGYQIPALVVCEQKMKDGFAVNWIIDGMQRTSVLDEFLADGFAVARNIERPIISYQIRKKDEKGRVLLENGIPVFETAEFDIRNKKFSAFPEELQKKIKDYPLTFEMYLGCTAEDVEYHIRRYNGGKPMNQNQKGQTHLGQEFAFLVNEVLKRPFFKNGYKMSEYVNASVNRVVDDAVMVINFCEDWKQNPVYLCKYLHDNATAEMFEEIGELADRMDAVLSDATREEVTRQTDSFIFFAAFKRFTEFRLPDSRFEDFMSAFVNGLKEKPVNGESYFVRDSAKNRATRNKRIVLGKIRQIFSLMNEFFGREDEVPAGVENGQELEEEDRPVSHEVDPELDSYVTSFEALKVLPEGTSRSKAERSAIQVALAVAGSEEPSDDSLAGELTVVDYENALLYTELCRDEWLAGNPVSPSSLPAMVAAYRAVVDNGKDPKEQKEAVEKTDLTGDYWTDYEALTSEGKRTA